MRCVSCWSPPVCKADQLYRRRAPRLDVAAHPLLYGEERRVVAGGAQLREIGLGVALVLARELRRGGDGPGRGRGAAPRGGVGSGAPRRAGRRGVGAWP